MYVIYSPKGKAAEYGALAANPYRNCGHGCIYCYVPQLFRCAPEEFNRPATLRPGFLERLEKDAKSMQAKHDTREIVMAFTCDPYHPGDTSATREAIKILIAHGLHFTVLTKGGTRAVRDFDLMRLHRTLSHDNTWLGQAKCRFGTTLTFSDPELSFKYEPGAAAPTDRVTALRLAAEAGIPTWVSCEPVLFPSETLKIMEFAMPYVWEFRIGATNYVSEIQKRMPLYQAPTRLEMTEFVYKVQELLKDRPKNRLIWKESMRPYLDAAGVP